MNIDVPAAFERNAARIVRAVGEAPVALYQFIAQRCAQNDPQHDVVFQLVFRSFYGLGRARMTREFNVRYFQILSSAKKTGSVDVADVVRSLYEIENAKGQRSLQFSFATKLVAILDPSAPIYDAHVAHFFGFRPPKASDGFDVQLAAYVAFYGDLKDLYRSILEQGRFMEARLRFRTLYGEAALGISETKVLDFMFWSAGRLLKTPRSARPRE